MLGKEGNNAEASRRAGRYHKGLITPHVGGRIGTDGATDDAWSLHVYSRSLKSGTEKWSLYHRVHYISARICGSPMKSLVLSGITQEAKEKMVCDRG